ncbi:unnamed protein product [Orchesella dallaii]|uniref:Uncharacterized protein n=1 Tax=Orchesella dallaii TaxID=48710 RepID=A0ABP1R553_9HEXA
MRDFAVENPFVAPSKVVVEVQPEFPASILQGLSKTDSLLRNIRSWRRPDGIKEPETRADICLNERQIKTTDGERFLFHDSGDDRRILIFATDKNIETENDSVEEFPTQIIATNSTPVKPLIPAGFDRTYSTAPIRKGRKRMQQADQREIIDMEEPFSTTDQRSTDNNHLNRPITRSMPKITATCEQDSKVAISNKVTSHGSHDDKKEQMPSKSQPVQKKKRRSKKELSDALEKLHIATVQNLAIERPPPAPGTYDVKLFNTTATTSATVPHANVNMYDPGHELDDNVLIRQEFIDELHKTDKS